jgi:TPP-dependent trihydroxycyclohexane-1,2-dione (THcHDO) dehydratase
MDIDATLAERGARYGDFGHHAMAAQAMQNVMRLNVGWDRLDAVKRQALTVIADKIARILTGDPEYRDNWHDIQGYAKLAEDRCADPAQSA